MTTEPVKQTQTISVKVIEVATDKDGKAITDKDGKTAMTEKTVERVIDVPIAEIVMGVEQWAQSEHNAKDPTMLGAFVMTMRSRGKRAASTNQFEAWFEDFKNES